MALKKEILENALKLYTPAGLINPESPRVGWVKEVKSEDGVVRIEIEIPEVAANAWLALNGRVAMEDFMDLEEAKDALNL